MLTLTKVSSVLTPVSNKARAFYSSIKNCWAWIDEKGTIWYFGQQRVVLSSDLSPSTSTSLADVTGLGLPVLANTRNAFRFVLYYLSAATTTGIKVGLTCPASPTYLSAVVSIYGVVADGTGAVFSGTIKASGDSVVSPTVEEASVVYPVVIEGVLLNGVNDGTIQLQWATEVGASGVTPKAGSHGRLWLP